VSVAVAGGGIIGLTLAWRLAQRGFAVTVFDKGAMGGEASWAGAGMLAPGGEILATSPIADLALEARRLYPSFVRELEEASGSRIDFEQCGALDLAYSAEDWRALEARVAPQAALGIRSEALEPDRALSICSHIRAAGLAGARFYPDDAMVNPRDIISALCSVCTKLGVTLVENRPVENLDSLETFEAVVVAAGAWSSQIWSSQTWSSQLSIRGLPAAEPVKGHLIGYRQPPGMYPTIIRHAHTYLLQRAGGLLIVGSSEEHVDFDRSIDSRIVSDLAARAAFILPHLLNETPSETWTGLRPASDRLHTGAHGTSGRLYLAYGHYRNGILLAPVTGRDLAAEISASFEKR
jgi:glycine oxidase